MPVTIAPATLRDMTYIAANMREADWREIAAVFAGSPGEVAASLVAASPDLAWIASLDTNPACAFGIARLLPGLGSGWAFGTRRLPQAMKSVTRYCLREVRPRLLQAGFRRIEVRSALDHDLSHRWLEHLGFTREGVARDYGTGGLDFATYAATQVRSLPL